MRDMVLIGDKLRINQVVVNLLGNAVKFTDDSGKIEFNVTVLEETENDVLFCFSVSDNGIGMSEEKRDKLFAPFEQADSSIAVKYGGTGLGLSISQNIIGMMGGEIKVESKEGEGSRFYFDIRIQKGGDNSLEEFNGPAPEKSDFSGKRILLAEDVEINRAIIREYLSSTGAVIDEALNGREALDMFGGSPENHYDLIVMDIQMPVLDGYETTKKLRLLNRGDAGNVPIIAMTANAYKEDVESALAAGMNGHLAKPSDTKSMMTVLNEYLGRNSGGAK
jgi:CheY-like chemotaxis protein